VRGNFGDGASVQYLLQPPVLERLGLHRKIALGRSAGATFGALARAKRLRGTKLDVFGRTAHRRMERGLADEYRQHIERALDHLASAAPDERDGAYERAVAVLALAGQVRGFDEIKEANVDVWRTASEQAFAELTARSTTMSSATTATR
jgi:indolepyruvate ferredoxin oxidoreductase